MIHGIVTSTEVSSGIVLANVQVARAGVTYKNVPMMHQFPGHIQSITEGSRVLMEKTEDNLMVILGVLETDEERLPEDVSEHEQVMVFDDGTEISVNPSDSEGYDVNINASSQVNIKASGDVTVESEGNLNLKSSSDGMDIETDGHLQFRSSSVDFDTSGSA
jgi:hypothetical protein